MRSSAPDSLSPAEHLRADHVALERRFADLSARAQTDDWRYLDAVWDDFADDLEAHLVYEEEALFPALRRRDEAGARLATRLCEEHERIRSNVQLLGVQIQLHAVRACTIDELLQSLREHAALEDEEFHGWAEHAIRTGAVPASVRAAPADAEPSHRTASA